MDMPHTSLNRRDAIVISSSVIVGCAVLLMTAVIVVKITIKVSRQRILTRRSRRLHMKNPLFLSIPPNNTAYHEIASSSPGQESDDMEFLRENIDFHELLGK